MLVWIAQQAHMLKGRSSAQVARAAMMCVACSSMQQDVEVVQRDLALHAKHVKQANTEQAARVVMREAAHLVNHVILDTLSM